MKARRLKVLAAIINASGKFTAEVVRGYCNTDRHPKGVRWRIPGKGRVGNRIIVKDLQGVVVLDHNAAMTYRTNSEVEYWMECYIK